MNTNNLIFTIQNQSKSSSDSRPASRNAIINNNSVIDMSYPLEISSKRFLSLGDTLKLMPTNSLDSSARIGGLPVFAKLYMFYLSLRALPRYPVFCLKKYLLLINSAARCTSGRKTKKYTLLYKLYHTRHTAGNDLCDNNHGEVLKTSQWCP